MTLHTYIAVLLSTDTALSDGSPRRACQCGSPGRPAQAHHRRSQVPQDQSVPIVCKSTQKKKKKAFSLFHPCAVPPMTQSINQSIDQYVTYHNHIYHDMHCALRPGSEHLPVGRRPGLESRGPGVKKSHLRQHLQRNQLVGHR